MLCIDTPDFTADQKERLVTFGEALIKGEINSVEI